MATAAETKRALVDAALALLAEGGRFSVRDVARRAGVNHGLVHRHFGSKEALVREAVILVAAELHLAHGRPGTRAFTVLRERPQIARLVARICLDGPADLLELAAPPRTRIGQAAARFRAALTGLDADPHVVNALGVAALLGWFVFRPMLQAGYRLPRDADDKLASLIDRVEQLLAPPAR